MAVTPVARARPGRAEVEGSAPAHFAQLAASAKVENVAMVRRDVVRQLAEWDIADCRDAVELVCAELLTNVLHYGETDVLEVELTLGPGWLRISVPDRKSVPAVSGHCERRRRGRPRGLPCRGPR